MTYFLLGFVWASFHELVSFAVIQVACEEWMQHSRRLFDRIVNDGS
jgi:hypothetical protein